MSSTRPPKTLDYDAQEVSMLRDLYTKMAKNNEMDQDSEGFVTVEQVFDEFARVRDFYKMKRRKH
jgi:hypothetical protein